MAASYPASAKSFTPIVDGVNYPQATDVNQAYDEITAVETALITGGLAHDVTPDSTANVRNLGTAAKQWKAVNVASGTVALPSVAVGDSDVGLYSSGTNALDLTTNAVKALGIDSTQFIDSPTQPRCAAYHSAAQSVTTGNTNVLTLDTEEFDVGTMHDTVTNNNRITVPTGGDGLYLCFGSSLMDRGADAIGVLHLRKNGSDIPGGAWYFDDAASAFAQTTTGTVQAILSLVAGDYVELAGQASGGTVSFGSATSQYKTRLNVVKLW